MASDETLMAEFRDTGSPEAFQELRNRHLERVRKYVGAHLNGPRKHLIDDVVQEIFLSIHENRSQFNPNSPANLFLPWFYTIAMNLVLDTLRCERSRKIASKRLKKILQNPA